MTPSWWPPPCRIDTTRFPPAYWIEAFGHAPNAIARSFANLREEVSVTLAADRGDLIAMARRDGEVLSEEYHDGVVAMRARVSVPVAGRLRKAAVASA